MGELYSFRKVTPGKSEPDCMRSPYYTTVISYCSHPHSFVNDDGKTVSEVVFVDGSIKCPRCREVCRNE